jgi:hypothetical protein
MQGATVLLTDNPVANASNDRYGFLRHAKLLCGEIMNSDSLPLSLGVFGPWGSGKSSFMNICRSVLSSQGVRTISFNPWKYDTRDEVWHAIIQSILTDIKEDPGAASGFGLESPSGLADKISRLSSTLAWLLTRGVVPTLSGGMLSAESLDKLHEAWTARQLENYRHVNVFEQDFCEVVDACVHDSEGKRLVIFIDDLDRCSGQEAIKVLDSLKLFLGNSSCVFVLGMDHEIIAEAAAKKQSGEIGRGRQYLEKLIQFPYHLPSISTEAIQRDLYPHVSRLGEDSSMWELIRIAFDGNPRKVRRFINAYNMAALTLGGQTEEPSRDRLMRMAELLAIRICFPDFFRRLQREPDLWERLEPEFERTGNRKAVEIYPGLGLFLERISKNRNGFNFPAPPSGAEIEALTSVLTVSGPDVP